MDTPLKSNTPDSKPKDEDSPFYSYVNKFSPIKTLPFSIPQTLSSLNSTSPSTSPVFASPPTASYKESRFRSQNNFYDPSKYGSAFNKDVTSTGEEEEKEEEAYGGMDLMTMCDNVKAKSPTPNWEPLISASAGLIYGSPNEYAYGCLLKRRPNSETRLCGGKMLASEPVLNSDVPNNTSMSVDALLNLHRGVRRRYLDFETPGSNQRTLSESSSRCVVPSIGLHLNAIPMFSRDNNAANESSFSRNKIVGLQSYPTPLLHSQPDIVREHEVVKDASQSAEEVAKSSALKVLNSNSPKKKRRKAVQAGEGESSCRRCNCKKSKCLKLYCECFAAGVYCSEPCSCIDCFNKSIHAETVLATRTQIETRNPLAFAPKVVRNSDSIIEIGDDASKTPASARHIRGCNCKKSNCLKKYCECYQSGVGCSTNCRCEGCKNAFGRKDGSSFEQDKENETFSQSRAANTYQNVELFNSAAPTSTSRQPLAQLPISLNNRLLPPQSQIHYGAFGSSSLGIYKVREPDMSTMSHSANETIIEDIYEMCENLIQSPITNIKGVASPNSRRASFPLLDSSESTPLRRNDGRSSIPTFPSLHNI